MQSNRKDQKSRQRKSGGRNAGPGRFKNIRPQREEKKESFIQKIFNR